jgi:hypothetical protein
MRSSGAFYADDQPAPECREGSLDLVEPGLVMKAEKLVDGVRCHAGAPLPRDFNGDPPS